MADVVSEGAAGRRTRTLRAEVALKALTADPGAPERLRSVLEQVLVFARASFAAVYAPSDDGELLCLVQAVGVPRTLYGLRDGYPRAGGSPVADVHRTGRAAWLGPQDLAESAEARRVPSRDFHLAVLPAHGDGGGGCLV
ncbi:MAG: PAS sensor protein, partial [Streptomyces sp.]|nr:PAS sensor protein [Streptomyces sp.]